ncbi:MAG: hypothetical protein AAGH79_13485, partial [Bacteroidota bacterium]
MYYQLTNFWVVLLVGGLFQISAFAETGEAVEEGIFDLMEVAKPLDLTLTTDLEILRNDRFFDGSTQGSLEFVDKYGNRQLWPIKVKLRGNFRRMHCADIPPLKIKFKKADLEEAGLAPFNDFKLVTQCVANEQQARDYIKREYLAYKMYNEVTEKSFRVQLLRITFVDTRTNMKFHQLAFVIEDTAQMRARLGAKKVKEIYNIPQERFDQEELRKVAVFQYAIGNSDWSLQTSRNLKMIEIEDKVYAIPYDFDFSGLVNASYASANSSWEMKTVRERIYMGFR